MSVSQFAQPLFAETEVVGNLGQHHAAHLFAQALAISAGVSLQRAPEQRDPIRQCCVVHRSPRTRPLPVALAPVEARPAPHRLRRTRTAPGEMTLKAPSSSPECCRMAAATIFAFLSGDTPARRMRTTPAATRFRR